MTQMSLGGYFSTLNIPASIFKTNGFGLSAEWKKYDGQYITFVSVGYFQKNSDLYSSNNLTPDAPNPTYIFFMDNDKIYNLSFDFMNPITSTKKRFALYLGAGAGIIHRVRTTSIQGNSSDKYTEKLTTFSFDFLLGGNANLGVVNIFVRGKAAISLKHVISHSDALPLLTSTQVGLLIPLKRSKKHRPGTRQIAFK
jgi:hypothetical protein